MMNMRIVRLILLGAFGMSCVFIANEGRALAGQEDRIDRQEKQYKANLEPRGRLYEMAKKEKKDHAILTFLSDRSVIAPNIRTLVRFSTDVIVGRVLENRARLSDKGDEIHKNVKVFVQLVYKGTITNGSSIDIKQLGGSWLYRDGTTLSWQPIDALPVMDGNSYVFFLIKEGGKENYIPSLGVQSVFRMEFDTSTIMPVDMNKRDPVVRKYQNISIDEFLNEIKSKIGEEVDGRMN